MKLKLTILFLLMFCYANAQDWENIAKKDLEELKTKFDSIKTSLNKEQKKLDDLVIGHSDGLQEQSNKVKDLKEKLVSTYNKRQDLLKFYLTKIVEDDDIMLLNNYFPKIKDYELLVEASKLSKTSSNLSDEGQKKVDGKKNTYKLPTLKAIYDFKTQTYITDALKPKHKQPVVLKITNINKFANTVEILANDIRVKDNFLDPDEIAVSTILKEDKPTEPIKNPTLPDLKIQDPKGFDDKKGTDNDGEINRLQSKIDGNTSRKEAQQVLFDQNEKLILEKSSRKLELDKLPKESLTLEDNSEIARLDSIIKKAEVDKVNNRKEIELLESLINKDYILLNEFNGTLGKFKNKIDPLVQKYTNLHELLVGINKINAAYNSYIQFIINPNLSSEHYNKNKSICKILDEARRNEYYAYITAFDNNYSAFIKQYHETFNDNLFYNITTKDPAYGNMVKYKFDNIKNEVETLYNLVSVSELRKKLNNIEILDKILSEEDAFTVTSDPVQALEDYVEFKIKIKQNNILGNSIIAQVPKTFTYIEYARGGVRWDFSVGTVFDFGIKNQEYEIKPITSSPSSFQIISNNKTQYTPTIAGLLHTSFRSNNMFAFGFSLGASIDLTSLNLNSFFPGISLLIGKREKIIFTAGPSFKKVKQLKEIYQTDTTYSGTIQAEDVTSPQFKIGGFFGISYNLTNSQKAKIKIAN
jgi:hypothetical protein